ncbi:tetratricopeptide repeat protein 24 [Cariama cristata]
MALYTVPVTEMKPEPAGPLRGERAFPRRRPAFVRATHGPDNFSRTQRTQPCSSTKPQAPASTIRGACNPLQAVFQAGRSPVPMASEEDANPGAQPPVPAAPAIRKKSRKKGKEKPEGGEDAQEEGDEAAGRATEIEGLTRAGHRALVLGDGRAAVGCFRKALVLSGGTGSPRLRRVCAFNLGAAYVESGKPKKGLEFLLQSQPSEGESRERLGDLSFNIGAAHEGFRDFPKALEYFGKAVGDDGVAQAGSRAGTRVQMGCCYLGMREPARAARCFLDAARTYAAAASPEAAAVALSRASGSMLQSRRFKAAEITGVLAECRSFCESIPDPSLRGKLYNDIGLGYSQLRIFSLAAENFERALALCGGEPDRRREAVLLQNLGAAHNALGSFGTALGWHRRAAALHSALGNRREQGQCFGNLAYACSQLRNHEAAAENYLHALQAFRDSGDVQGQWQACEGLGAACFHLGDPRKAIGHYKEALTLLSRCQDPPRAAGERIVHKLTDAIQHQLCLRGRLSRGRPFRGKAQPGDELHAPVPGARPGRSALSDGPPLDLHNRLDTSGEDEDGPRMAPGYQSQPRAHSPTGDPTVATAGCRPCESREPRTGSRMRSLICSLV